ncbi:MAG TPA: Dps family protein [Blastocatellia bacterium]|nr:Dps family protein [Blastocatellia bacterium]
MSKVKVQNRNAVIESLQQQVANAFVLYANYKKYHWLSYGPLFRDLHLLFDEHAKAVLDAIDEFGERVRILGGVPLADPRQFAERGTVEVTTADQSMRQMVEEAARNHRRVIQEMREAINTADEAGDPGTADLFTRILQIHEKQEWFLREVLARQDGLIG